MKKITYYLSIGLLAYTGIVLADACDDLEIKLGKAKADVEYSFNNGSTWEKLQKSGTTIIIKLLENKGHQETIKTRLKIKADNQIVYDGDVGKDYCGVPNF